MGSAKSFYSSEAGGSEVEIAIQPGSARFAGSQTFVPPHSGEQAGRCGRGWGGCGWLLGLQLRGHRAACFLSLDDY
jgi:hypothetical protein